MKLIFYTATKTERLPPAERPKLVVQQKVRSLLRRSKRGIHRLDPEILREVVMSALPKPTELPRLPHAAIRQAYNSPMKAGKPLQGGQDEPSCPRRRIRWESQVTVVEIPSHREYSSSVRDSLYTPRMTVHANRVRNYLEFSANGENWRECREEDEFIVVAGMLLHPHTASLCLQVLAEREQEPTAVEV